MILLSTSIILNGSVSADSAQHLSQTGSSLLSNIVLPGQHYNGGTLFDMYSYQHHNLFGLRI